MTKRRLSESIGIILILAHLGIVALAVAVFLRGHFLPEELKITLAIVGPPLAAYGAAAMAYIASNHVHQVDTSPKVSGAFLILSWLLPAAMFAAITLIIINQNQHRGLVEDYALALGAIEAAMGAYVGTIAKTLFEQQKQQTPAPVLR